MKSHEYEILAQNLIQLPNPVRKGIENAKTTISSEWWLYVSTVFTSGRRSSEKVGRWTNAEGESWEGLLLPGFGGSGDIQGKLVKEYRRIWG